MKTIICLANSRKPPSGRCIAGKEFESGTTGNWIRPVSSRPGREVSEEERRYQEGAKVQLLDVVGVPLKQFSPMGHQVENHILDDQYYWTKCAVASWKQVQAATDSYDPAFWSNCQSTFYGQNDMSSEVYTVGHSIHAVDKFIELLRAHKVTAIADVRSTPYSRRNPQFNREELRAALKEHAIQYAFLGKELGARSDDECCYVNDKVQYALLAKTPLFRSGIERVVEGIRSHKIALMCAEKDPLDCHRTILVARTLAQAGFGIMHILYDGSLETHDHALGRLIDRLGLAHEDMFRSRAISVEEAYEKQGQRIAFERAAPHVTLNETEVQ